jgi:hypothetical protein
MLYSTTLFIGLGLYVSHSVAFYIVYDQFAQISVRFQYLAVIPSTACRLELILFIQSIIPTLILLLVGMKLTSNDVHETMQAEKHAMSPIMDGNSRRLSFASNRAGVMASNRGSSMTMLESDHKSKFNAPQNDIGPHYSQ